MIFYLKNTVLLVKNLFLLYFIVKTISKHFFLFLLYYNYIHIYYLYLNIYFLPNLNPIQLYIHNLYQTNYTILYQKNIFIINLQYQLKNLVYFFILFQKYHLYLHQNNYILFLQIYQLYCLLFQ